MSLLQKLKKIPLDLGQGNMRFTTMGKKIGLSYIQIPQDGERALDIGCREGYQTEFLKNLGYGVTSIDIDPIYHDAKIVDLEKSIPFYDQTFDLIWCSEVIEHLNNPHFTVGEMRRVLKLGGKLIVTTPNSKAWFFRLLALFGITPDKLQNPDHKQFFSYRDIRRLFPQGKIFGFFPYVGIKRKIKLGVEFLSPTFIIIEKG